MAMTIACPSCGVKRRLDANSMGLKIKCDCGISFSVSPVFAVPDERVGPAQWLAARLQRPSQRVVTALGVLVLLGGSAALAAWMMNRGPSAAPADPSPNP